METCIHCKEKAAAYMEVEGKRIYLCAGHGWRELDRGETVVLLAPIHIVEIHGTIEKSK